MGSQGVDRIIHHVPWQYRMCDLAPQLWPGITNDMQLYREIAIPAHTTGYRYGVQLLNSMEVSDQRKFAEKILDEQVSPHGGPRSLQILAEMLTHRMEEQGVSSVHDLFSALTFTATSPLNVSEKPLPLSLVVSKC